ncbi:MULTISPECIES: hypothetical protein [unclassified Bartonella]|uniref:hypothetical protein n=1 Tax=unclassified Bartonella TaxID=2645622 RepID=UPI0035D079F3
MMINFFNNNMLIISMISVFYISQTVSVHANYLQNNIHRENIFISVTEQNRKDAISTIALYTQNLNRCMENEITVEGKFEKVVEPLTLGAFGMGMALGYASSTIGMFLGWLISKIILYFKSR